MPKRSVGLGGRRLLDSGTTLCAKDFRCPRLVATRWFRAILELGQTYAKNLQHRHPLAVVSFVIDQQAQLVLAEGTDPVPQVPE